MNPRPFEKPDGTIDLHYEYLRFAKPGTEGELVFAFPRSIPMPQCLKAARSLVPDGYQYMEHPDGYGREQNADEIEAWRAANIQAQYERLTA